MKRTRDEQNLCTSVRYQLKQSEPNRTIRLPLSSSSSGNDLNSEHQPSVCESSLSLSCHPRIRQSSENSSFVSHPRGRVVVVSKEPVVFEESSSVVFEESSSGCSNSPTRWKCARIEWEDLFVLDEKTLYLVNIELYFNESLAKLSRVFTNILA